VGHKGGLEAVDKNALLLPAIEPQVLDAAACSIITMPTSETHSDE
jgi:hypothetical protein